MNRYAPLLLLLLLIASTGWAGRLAAAQQGENWKLLERYPHDRDSFTQGLAIVDSRIYESSGRYGQSWIGYRPVPGPGAQPERRAGSDLHRGPEQSTEQTWLRKEIDRRRFAEGLTLLNNTLYLLTWRAGRALVLDPETLHVRRRHRYPGEGWGLTHNGGQLIMSDGSSELRFIDPDNFKELHRLTVTEHGQPLDRLNELEWVDGWILANIWQSDDVAIIDPDTGEVAGRLRLAALYPPEQRSPEAGVLNGLAWDPANNTLLVTGKLWPEMFRLRVRLPTHTKTSSYP